MVRDFKNGDELELYEVFYSSIHVNAKEFYSKEQLYAWAPKMTDVIIWKKRMQKIKPFILEDDGVILGYADLQNNGYIDHFFVRGNNHKKGLGQKLMDRILDEAKKLKISELSSDVSLSAEAFFIKNRFEIIKRKKVKIRGVELDNSLMKRKMEY